MKKAPAKSHYKAVISPWILLFSVGLAGMRKFWIDQWFPDWALAYDVYNVNVNLVEI